MKISILSQEHFLTSQWSGGTSTQLYIFPANASYPERNFVLRISTAKVEVETSTFTALPGFHRKLMILEGEITINHKGHYTMHLKPFDVDNFSGDWNTRSSGTCTDFNVMISGSMRSKLYHVLMDSNSNYILEPQKNCKHLFLYPTSGTVQFQLKNKNYVLETGDLLVIEKGDGSEISLNSADGFGLVVVEVN